MTKHTSVLAGTPARDPASPPSSQDRDPSTGVSTQAVNGFDRHGITHLSPSSLNLFINAPALWVAEKIFGRRGAQSAAMARGIAVEDAVVGVVAKGQSAQDATDAALKRFDSRFFMADEKTMKEREVVAPMVEQALKVVAPLGVPEFPEEGQNKVELVCNCGHFKIPFIGYLDLFYPQHGKVIDLKSTLRMPSRMSDSHVRQRLIYARAMQNHDVQFLYVTPTKAEFRADGDVIEGLTEIKAHVVRLERFLRTLSSDEMRDCVPVNPSDFYWNGSESIRRELYGL